MNNFRECLNLPKFLTVMQWFDMGGSDAAGQAADAQVQAAQIAADTQERMYKQTRSDLEPYRAAGTNALNRYQSLLGLTAPPSGYESAAPGSQVGTYQGQPIYTQDGKLVFRNPNYGQAGGNALATGAGPQQQLYRDANGQVFSPDVSVLPFPGGNNLATGQQQAGYNGPISFLTPQGDFQNLTAIGNYGAASPGGGGGAVSEWSPFTGDQSQITWNQGMGAQSSEDYLNDYLKSTPGYQFQVNEGINALDRSAAARGRLLSGAQDRAITRYGQDYATTQYNSLLDRISNLSGSGQNAAAQLGAIGSQTAQGVAQTQLASGNAQAQGYINAANSRQSAFNSGVNTLSGLGGLALGAISLFSDKRTKKNIRYTKGGNALAIIRKLKPASFKYKEEYGGGGKQQGFIAQDVEKVFPKAVVKGPKGMKMLDITALNSLATQAEQEARHG